MVSKASSQVDWTVGRCNRLMRPLVTRIQKLRVLQEEKEISQRKSMATNANKAQDSDSSDDSSDDTAPTTKNTKCNDPDWMSVPKKKKGSKAYSARNTSNKQAATEVRVRTPARSKMQASLRPGELSIPTPYLARNPATTPGSSNKPVKSGRFENSVSNMLEYRKKAYFAEGEDEEAVASNLTKTFVDILHATNSSIDPVEQKLCTKSRGPRSLWATCCSKFGTIIGQVEADPDPEEGGPLDAAGEFYAMAEDLELPERKPGGRLQLRLIVRAHATYVMAGAIEEGLIPIKVLKQWLPHMLRPTSLSGQPASILEGEVLLSKSHALVTTTTHGFTCPGKHRNHFYAHLFNFVLSQAAYIGKDARLAFDYRQMLTVLHRPDIPVEWMGSRRMLPLWKNVFRTLLDSPSAQEIQDAYKLLRQTVSLAVGLESSSSAAEKVLLEIPADFVHQSANCPKCPRAHFGTFLVDTSPLSERPMSDLKLSKAQLTDALSNTISSMSTMFSSFAIAYSIKPVAIPNINVQAILSVLNLLSLEISQSYAKSERLSCGKTETSAADVKHSKVMACRAVSILAATILPQTAGCQFSAGLGFVPLNNIVRLLKTLDSETRKNSADLTTILDCLPELVCSIARRTSQLLKADSFDTLCNLVRSLVTPDVVGQEISSSTTLFLRQLAFSSAHQFAATTREVAHYSLIGEIEKEIGATEHFDVSKTPFRSSTKPQIEHRGFKWEEGICEWVLATPKPFKAKANKPKNITSPTSESEEDSSEDDLPGTQDTDVHDASVNYLSQLIASSSPISGFPTSFGKNNSTMPAMREESERVRNIEVTQLKVPILKRPSSVYHESSDDELSFNEPHSRKRPSRSNLRSSSSGRAKSRSRSKLMKNTKREDSEDELSFA
jgi:hypothetical protein